jgi:hypothetical protein
MCSPLRSTYVQPLAQHFRLKLRSDDAEDGKERRERRDDESDTDPGVRHAASILFCRWYDKLPAGKP